MYVCEGERITKRNDIVSPLECGKCYNKVTVKGYESSLVVLVSGYKRSKIKLSRVVGQGAEDSFRKMGLINGQRNIAWTKN